MLKFNDFLKENVQLNEENIKDSHWKHEPLSTKRSDYDSGAEHGEAKDINKWAHEITKHKEKAEAAKKKGDMHAYHKHMETHHDEARIFHHESESGEHHLSPANQEEHGSYFGHERASEYHRLKAERLEKKHVKESWSAQAGKAKMSEADVDESGLRMAAHAAHKEGKKEFEFQGKTYPVKVQKEEVEQIDELSKDTLASYTKKASHDARIKQHVAADFKSKAAHARNPRKKETWDSLAGKYQSQAWKREKGHDKAVDKLKEDVQLDEGKMKELAYDLQNMGHDEFHKHYGHPKHHYDPTNFKKPVEKGHEMDRAKALAQRGMQSLSKEEVERIEEKLTQIDELSNKTLGNYVKKASSDLASSIHNERDAEENDDAPEASEHGRRASNRMSGLERAGKKIAKEEVELEEATTRKDFQMVADLIKGHESAEKRKELATHHAGIFAKQNPRFDHAKFMKAAGVNEGEMCEDEMRFPKDGWSKNDSMAKPVKSSDAMKQHSHYFSKVTKLDPKTGNPVKEEVSQEISPYLKATLQVMDEGKIDEGKMKDIYTDMMDHATKKGYSSHKQFTPTDYETVGKQHGISGKELAIVAGHKTAQQADTHFKKPVEPGKGMDRAKALAQRGMQSLSKEEVERIEEKLTQIDELSKKTLGSYAHKATDDAQDKAHDAYDSGTPTRHELEIQGGKNNQGKYGHKPLQNRLTGLARASKKLGDKGIGKDVEKSVAHHLKQRYHYDNMDDGKASRSDDAALRQSSKAHEKIHKASGVKEEVSQEMSPYVKGTLAVMDEGKIDDLRDAQKLRQASQSAYDPKFKPDTSHPHINLVKGTAYGGANQKDDETDEKPDDETKEKRGRGRPAGSKSGARV